MAQKCNSKPAPPTPRGPLNEDSPIKPAVTGRVPQRPQAPPPKK